MNNVTENTKPDTPFTREDHSDALHLHAAEIDANLCELHAAFLEVEAELPKAHGAIKIVRERIARIHTETAHMRRASFVASEAAPEPATREPGGTLIEDVASSTRTALESLRQARYRFDELYRAASLDADPNLAHNYGEDYVDGSMALHAVSNDLENIDQLTTPEQGGAS